MKNAFNRAFTKKEIVLIVILVIILVGMVYFRFVDQNVRENLNKAKEDITTNQSELEISSAQLARLNSMDNELTSYEAGGTSYLASYNNIKEELSLLDSLLEPTHDYSLSLSDPVQSGDLVRRNIAIRFTTGDFGRALSVVRSLNKSNLRNIIRDISYSGSTGRNGEGSVTVNLNATFYETIVGGKADAGLIVESTQEAPVTEEDAAALE